MARRVMEQFVAFLMLLDTFSGDNCGRDGDREPRKG